MRLPVTTTVGVPSGTVGIQFAVVLRSYTDHVTTCRTGSAVIDLNTIEPVAFGNPVASSVGAQPNPTIIQIPKLAIVVGAVHTLVHVGMYFLVPVGQLAPCGSTIGGFPYHVSHEIDDVGIDAIYSQSGVVIALSGVGGVVGVAGEERG